MTLIRCILSFLVIVSGVVDAAICYNPDRSTTDNVPCNIDAGNSTCCAKGASCLSNNLCLDPTFRGQDGLSINNKYYRGACTDKTWNSTACAPICKTKLPGFGEGVVYCGSGEYCCQEDASNCCDSNSAKKFNLGEPKIFNIAGNQVVGTAVSVPSATSSGSRTSSSTSSSSPSPTNDSGASSTTSDQDPPNNSKGKTLALSLGIGLSLGILLIAITIGAFWWIKRLQRRQKETQIEMKAQLKEQELRFDNMEHALRQAYFDGRQFELPSREEVSHEVGDRGEKTTYRHEVE
ncbi:hypothetical protein BDV96DRAFT_21947 [Lophiotrema nucula]|uniref:Mid2 domain-containing protein n=1 Tax=Lophiotrema nucula TaxID=690887 RepID=A0A6A5ZCJ4_9PLEO|nr:hypothetical protein BDV96DRAFT_21947 [Lophiotrema nucula]